MKKLIQHVAAATVLATAGIGAASANVVVNYEVPNYTGAQPGTFSGNDSNADGVLSLSELTSFVFDNTYWGHHVTLSDLAGFGDFNYLTNVWTANGAGWNGNKSYFSWNSGNSAVDSTWALVTTSVESASAVPEPASLALFGLGVLGMGALRRKNKA